MTEINDRFIIDHDHAKKPTTPPDEVVVLDSDDPNVRYILTRPAYSVSTQYRASAGGVDHWSLSHPDHNRIDDTAMSEIYAHSPQEAVRAYLDMQPGGRL